MVADFLVNVSDSILALSTPISHEDLLLQLLQILGQLLHVLGQTHVQVHGKGCHLLLQITCIANTEVVRDTCRFHFVPMGSILPSQVLVYLCRL